MVTGGSAARMLALLAIVPAACGGPEVKITASALSRSATAAQSGGLLASLEQPLLGEAEYDGMGVNYGDAVVAGLKLRLLKVQFGQGKPGAPDSTDKDVFRWQEAPREIEISDGFAGVIEDTADIAPGTYDSVTVVVQGSYALKAYAYMDSDFDGVVDTTLYTTATEVRKADAKVLPAALTDWDYLESNRTWAHVPPGNEWGAITIPPQPFVVAADTTQLAVDLRIDSFRIAKAWDGRPGDTDYPPQHPGQVPRPGPPFAWAGLEWKYEPGKPVFGLMLVPMFAFGSTGTLSPISQETYLIDETPTFDAFRAAVLTVVFQGGKPVLGKVATTARLEYGEVAKVFAQEADGSWSFYVGGTSKQDDGGFFYGDDPARAAHRITGFRPSVAVGHVQTVTFANAARCDDVHNYCVPDASGRATADNGATKPISLKRVR